MAVKMGYKETEVGVIPEEWDVKPLQELCIAVLDCHHSTPVWTKAGAVVIRNQNIRDGKLDLSEASFTNDQHFAERTRRATPMFGDLVITREAPMGLVCMIPEGLRCCLGQRMVLLRLNCEEASSTYVLYALLGEDVQRSISVAGGTGSTVSNLRIPVLKQLKIFVPGLPEQQAIATALSDVDALLSALERLLAKKRDLKQGAMQQLLTGQIRLPGFYEEWVVKRLGDVARIQRGASPRPIDSPVWFDQNSSVGWVRISDVTKSGMYLRETTQRLSPLGVQYSRPVARGSLIMSICATVGRPVVTEIDVCIHDGFVVFDDLQADKLFIYYTLKWIEPNWSKHGQTGSQMNLNTGLITGTEVSLPPLPEQTAIAAVLSDMDAELATLEHRLVKTRALKQGMMQELLTGRTRLL
ncbi:restriction endonuclease subunit S [Pseudomonas bubulae]|jgi:type I restriction enzyme S subunit|uniref:restriction endonuclease subunit S n=1 Tax=Pseudomonas bubulae TaxID=2316085 RepID=UPI003CFD1506